MNPLPQTPLLSKPANFPKENLSQEALTIFQKGKDISFF
jgi:hypothetical protein